MTFKDGNYRTPANEMYERNHNLIPEIDAEDYELELMGSLGDEEPLATLTLEELKKMPEHSVETIIACAGNRRKALQAIFPRVKGLPWTNGAIGNALYKGVPMRHILLEVMKLREEDLIGKGLHLVMVSYDSDFQGKPYEVSIPLEDALNPTNEIIVAYEMNGEDIPKVHGYPVRVVCPGYIGVRCPKWLNRLVISTEEADSAPQRNDYKIVSEKDITKVDWSAYKCVYTNILNSAFVYPGYDEEIAASDDKTVEIQGWAHGNG